MPRFHILRLLVGLTVVLSLSLPSEARAASPAPTLFDEPELGINMHLSPAGLFGLIGGSLAIAPLPFLVLEPGVAQRIDEKRRLVGLVRARLVRTRG